MNNLNLADLILAANVLLIGITGFFLKSIHDKVQASISRKEVESMLTELKAEHARDRLELRLDQEKLFSKMETHGNVIAGVDAKMTMILEFLQRRERVS